MVPTRSLPAPSAESDTAAKMTYFTESADSADLLTPVHRLRDTTAGRQLLIDSGRYSPDQDRRKAKKNHHQHYESLWEHGTFVGWDGEGVDVAGRHRYVILANSLGDAVVNDKGITTAQAFDLFLRTAVKTPKAIHVIFGGGYDFNMILRSAMTLHQARILADTGRLTLRVDGVRYGITYHPRHEFTLRREEWNDEKGVIERFERITVWDIFGSFQSSFVTACKRILPDKDLAELEAIQIGKDKRGRNRLGDIPEMLNYCRAELRALVRLAECDRDNFDAAGFRTTRFDGAGAKASAVLRTKGVGKHKSPTPDELQVPTRAAYAGGRIESYRFGDFTGPVWSVDIRSAYPWAATFLPSLADGWWERVGNVGPDSPDEFSVWKVSYRGKTADTLHPFFWRSRRGDICYPQNTTGWYWAPEVAAATELAKGRIRLLDGYRFHPRMGSPAPFSFIPDLFRIRSVLERQVRGRGWPLKLALNSLYGKTAQQIGGKDGKPPRWHQLEWAGWITSKTRATVYRLAAARLDQLVSIETDGVCFAGAPPDDLIYPQVGDNLGDYELAEYDAGTWVQSGIYWLHDQDGWHPPKVRGVGRREDGSDILTREGFVDMWDRSDFGAVTVDVTRFRGLVTSSISATRWRDWCQWITEPREITATPSGKRVHMVTECPECRNPAGGLHSTLPTGGGSPSTLHSLSWESKLGRTTADEWWLDTLEQEDGE